MSATDEQFAAAHQAFVSALQKPNETPADWGRQMLAALEAHGCIPKPQGLTVRQELAARLTCAKLQGGAGVGPMTITELADAILALGEPQ